MMWGFRVRVCVIGPAGLVGVGRIVKEQSWGHVLLYPYTTIKSLSGYMNPKPTPF